MDNVYSTNMKYPSDVVLRNPGSVAPNVTQEEVVAVARYTSREASKRRANAMKRERNIQMTSVFFPVN